jgi:hypothetical protein
VTFLPHTGTRRASRERKSCHRVSYSLPNSKQDTDQRAGRVFRVGKAGYDAAAQRLGGKMPSERAKSAGPSSITTRSPGRRFGPRRGPH